MSKRTAQEYKVLLEEQIDFLKSSARRFDEGVIGEAKRMALNIRVLLHDCGSGVSLLTQIGKLSVMGFLDSAMVDYSTDNLLTYSGLLSIRTYSSPLPDGSYTENHPLLADGGNDRFLNFYDWWNKIIYTNDVRVPFTRSQIVLTVSNKEGGAHIDREPDDKLRGVSTGENDGWKEYRDGISYPVANSDLVMIRQIAYELLSSLELDRSPNSTHKDPIPTYDKVRQTWLLVEKGLRQPNLNKPINQAIRQGYSEALTILKEHRMSYMGIDDMPFKQCREIATKAVDYLNGKCTQNDLLQMLPKT